MLNPEVWRRIPGVDALIWVSRNGGLLTLRSGAYVPKGNLKIRDGYQYFRYKTAGRRKEMAVSRSVALAFIPNPDGKPEVNHKNKQRLDNRENNLEWVTKKENKRHSMEFGLPTMPMIPLETFGHVFHGCDCV